MKIVGLLLVLTSYLSLAQGFLWNPWADPSEKIQNEFILDKKFSHLLESNNKVKPNIESYEDISKDWLMSCRHVEMRMNRIQEYRFWIELISKQLKKAYEDNEIEKLESILSSYKELLKTSLATFPNELYKQVAKAKIEWSLPADLQPHQLENSSIALMRYSNIDIAPTDQIVDVLERESLLEVIEHKVRLSTPISLADLCFDIPPQVILIANCNIWKDEDRCLDKKVFQFVSNYQEFPWEKAKVRKSLKDDYGSDEEN